MTAEFCIRIKVDNFAIKNKGEMMDAVKKIVSQIDADLDEDIVRSIELLNHTLTISG